MSTLSLWIVYAGASDYPRGHIARRWEIGPSGEPQPTTDVMLEPDLATLRECLELMGLTNIGRDAGDDPVIVEVWM